jgi:hypothetical protein
LAPVQTAGQPQQAPEEEMRHEESLEGEGQGRVRLHPHRQRHPKVMRHLWPGVRDRSTQLQLAVVVVGAQLSASAHQAWLG